MKKILVLLCVLLLLVGCHKTSNQSTLKRFQNTTVSSGFDTEITLLAYAENEKEFNKYFDLLKSEFTRYNQIFDIYNNYDNVNNLKTVNDKAGQEKVTVDQSLIDVLTLVKTEYAETQHEFNPVAGSVLSIWHKYREEGILLNGNNKPGLVPSKEELESAGKCIDINLLEIDKSNKTLYLTKPCASLDLGGIAKGYATEQVALTLEKAGLKHGIVNAGGNVRVIGSKPDGKPWAVGIGYPTLIQKDNVNVFSIDQTMSIVTSGDYQRFYQDANNKRYSHLIDMDTLFPGTYYRSVSIFTKSSTMADLLSTVLYLMDYNQGKAFIEKFNKNHPEHHIEVMWIIDKSTTTDMNHPDFQTSKEFPELKVAMTQGLKSKVK